MTRGKHKVLGIIFDWLVILPHTFLKERIGSSFEINVGHPFTHSAPVQAVLSVWNGFSPATSILFFF